jgi:hypothetical protein
MLVPLIVLYPPFSQVDLMAEPGAPYSIGGLPKFE